QLLRLAHDLREAGIRCEYALGGQKLDKQLKLADARQARLAVVIGPDDRAKGEVQLKDLATKTQGAVGTAAIVETITARLTAS
ncbi:MAG TPA: His/Gly/Thr/Pro-type tRNA ligase C-terminal domain-containing protein, partial [Gemmatimonadales bacterium]|nr:His/Gly/Thr/Pro-type tRNA ligase C-terminal domain-containing protein [Gemmatimonadales bacterium]